MNKQEEQAYLTGQHMMALSLLSQLNLFLPEGTNNKPLDKKYELEVRLKCYEICDYLKIERDHKFDSLHLADILERILDKLHETKVD